MDISRLDQRHVEVVRERIPELAAHIVSDQDDDNPEYFKGVDIEDPEQVFNAIVSHAEKDGCGCVKCATMNIVLTMFAVYFHDLMNDEGLEWSDRQKARLSKAFFEISMGAGNTIVGLSSEYKKKAMMDALLASILSGGNTEVVGVPNDIMSGIVDKLKELKNQQQRDDEDTEE